MIILGALKGPSGITEVSTFVCTRALHRDHPVTHYLLIKCHPRPLYTSSHLGYQGGPVRSVRLSTNVLRGLRRNPHALIQLTRVQIKSLAPAKTQHSRSKINAAFSRKHKTNSQNRFSAYKSTHISYIFYIFYSHLRLSSRSLLQPTNRLLRPRSPRRMRLWVLHDPQRSFSLLAILPKLNREPLVR